MSDATTLPNARGTHALGPSFDAAFLASGLARACASWGPDGVFTWVEGATDAERAAVAAFVAGHDPADRRPELLTYAARRRWEMETGGIVLNGARIATDEKSQSKIGNAYQLLLASGAPSVEFKTEDGFVTLSVEQFRTLALAVGVHVQSCFAKEAEVEATIAAMQPTVGTEEAVAAAFTAAIAGIDAAFAPLAPAT